MPFTPSYVTLPQKEKGQYRFSWLRVAVISLLLFVLLGLCLFLHHTAFSALENDFSSMEKKNSSWIVGELGLMLPLITVALFQLAVYAKHDRKNAVAQREMAWEIIIATLLIYAVVLPVIMYISDQRLTLALAADAAVEQTEGKEYRTLMMDMAEWFIRLPVPMLLLYIFHRSKAEHELTEPETPEMPEAASAVETSTDETVETVESTAANTEPSAQSENAPLSEKAPADQGAVE